MRRAERRKRKIRNRPEEGGGGAVKRKDELITKERGRETRLKSVSPYSSLINLAVTYCSSLTHKCTQTFYTVTV